MIRRPETRKWTIIIKRKTRDANEEKAGGNGVQQAWFSMNEAGSETAPWRAGWLGEAREGRCAEEQEGHSTHSQQHGLGQVRPGGRPVFRRRRVAARAGVGAGAVLVLPGDPAGIYTCPEAAV